MEITATMPTSTTFTHHSQIVTAGTFRLWDCPATINTDTATIPTTDGSTHSPSWRAYPRCLTVPTSSCRPCRQHWDAPSLRLADTSPDISGTASSSILTVEGVFYHCHRWNDKKCIFVAWKTQNRFVLWLNHTLKIPDFSRLFPDLQKIVEKRWKKLKFKTRK